MKKIIVNPKLCSGCNTCVLNCSFMHHKAFSHKLSNIRIIGKEERADFKPTLCIQCEERNCVKVCPVEAISINEETGAVIVNKDKCILCEMCIDACEHNAIRKTNDTNNDEYIAICDLCNGDPHCVKYCRLGALKYE